MDSGETPARKSYAVSGRIMLSAIVILSFVVVMIVCLHLYARWYLLSARRRRARSRRTRHVFYAGPSATPSGGLDPALVKSLPIFTFNPGSYPDPIECAVCLSEFEENETGRTLPECKHSFHTDCIDMWFHSYTTCPLCRSPVQPVLEDPDRLDPPPEMSTCQHGEQLGFASTSSFRGVTVEIPRRNGGFEDESVAESPAFRSPMTRMLSFRRILSRERRGNVSPSHGGGFAAESDVERGL